MRQIVLILFGLITLGGVAVAADDFVVIVHPASTVASLSETQVRDIYLGYKRTWPGGAAISPLAQQDKELTAAFCKSVMHYALQQYFLHWRKQIFTGQGTPPIEVADDVAMKKFVALNPGAIGYIHRSALDPSIKELPLR